MSLLKMLPSPARTSSASLPHAVYIVPHQDDELLTMGAAMMRDRAEGRKVYAVLICRGNKSVVRTSGSLTTFLGYTPTEVEFGAARDREFIESVKRLGGIPVVLPWADRMDERTATPEGVVSIVKSAAPAGGVLRTTSYTDYHEDHRACGVGATMLEDEQWGTDLRLMLSSERNVNHAPSGVTLSQMGKTNGITTYHSWPYTYRHKDEGWWGVGYVSVTQSFDYMLNTNSASYWHPQMLFSAYPGLAVPRTTWPNFEKVGG